MSFEKKQSGFGGQMQLEGLRDVWAALFSEEDAFAGHLCALMREREGTLACQSVLPNGSLAALTLYTEDRSAFVAVSTKRKKDTDPSFFCSCAPLFPGTATKVRIEDVYIWGTAVEATVAVSVPALDDFVLTFFAPTFCHERERYVIGQEIYVYLSALALDCHTTPQNEVVVNRGPFFEERLSAFLRQHPEKTVQDFSPPTFSLQGSRMLYPMKYAAQWTYRVPVLSVSRATLFHHTLFTCMVELGSVDQPLKLPLYVPSARLETEPVIGDELQGILWLTCSCGQLPTA